jgi:hypothetical protein
LLACEVHHSQGGLCQVEASTRVDLPGPPTGHAFLCGYQMLSPSQPDVSVALVIDPDRDTGSYAFQLSIAFNASPTDREWRSRMFNVEATDPSRVTPDFAPDTVDLELTDLAEQTWSRPLSTARVLVDASWPLKPPETGDAVIRVGAVKFDDQKVITATIALSLSVRDDSWTEILPPE